MSDDTNNGNVMLLLGRIDQHDNTLEKHDERITKLETGKAWAMGVAAAVSTAVGLALQFLLKG